MSFSALVRCNCYKEGKTSPPPYRDFISMDTEGIFLELPKKWYYKLFPSLYYKAHIKFDNWHRSACPHSDMEYSKEWITNISGMMAFKRAIREAGGKEKYPILLQELPQSNGGYLPIELTILFLRELELMERENKSEELICLKEKRTDKFVWETNINNIDAFIMDGKNGLYFTLSIEGLTILDNNSELMFRGNEFSQIREGKNYRFKDFGSEIEFLSPTKLPLENEEEEKEEYYFYTERVNVPIMDNYGSIINALKNLCKASLEINNPIIWT